MTHSIWHRLAPVPARTCDVAVVGAGLMGCATAFWVHRLRPAWRVLLLDARAPGDGASGRNAGFLRPGVATDYAADVARYGRDRARRLWAFTSDNIDLLRAEVRPDAMGLEAVGSLTVAGSAAEDERLRASVVPMRGEGFPAAYIDPGETAERIMGQGFGGALYVPSGAMLDPLRLVRHLAAESRAEVLEGHRLLEWEEVSSGYRLHTTRGEVRAGQVVLALNAGLGAVLPAARAYLRPVRAQMLAYRPPVGRWLRQPVNAHEGHYYFRQLADGTMLLGGARHRHREAEETDLDAVTPALQADLERFLFRHFPQTAGGQVMHRWSGTMGFTWEGVPVVLPVGGQGGWAAGGFSGRGLAFAFKLARLLAEGLAGYPRSEALDLFRAPRPDHVLS